MLRTWRTGNPLAAEVCLNHLWFELPLAVFCNHGCKRQPRCCRRPSSNFEETILIILMQKWREPSKECTFFTQAEVWVRHREEGIQILPL